MINDVKMHNRNELSCKIILLWKIIEWNVGDAVPHELSFMILYFIVQINRS